MAQSYHVTVSVTASWSVPVEASSEEEAKEKAILEVDPLCQLLDCDDFDRSAEIDN